MKEARAIAFSLVVLVSVAAMALADAVGTTSKISAAQSLVAAGKGKEASAELAAVADMMGKDAAGSGAFAEAFAAWQAGTAKSLGAEAAKGAKLKEAALEMLAVRAADLYGAIIPAGKGDMAAAAAYLTKAAAGATEGAKERLDNAAKTASEAAAGKGNKTVAAGTIHVTLGSSTALERVIELIDAGKYKVAAVWVRSVAEYMAVEEKLADQQTAEAIADLITGVKQIAFDLDSAPIPSEEEMRVLLKDIEGQVLDAYQAAVTAVPAAGSSVEKKAEPAAKPATGEAADKPKGEAKEK